MGRSRVPIPGLHPAASPAFLLSQVGAHASALFADLLTPLNLAPPHVGILRVISEADGLSQQALGEKIGMFASRLVAVIDELEERGLVERRDSPADRRSYALYVTKAGRKALEQIIQIAHAHENALCAALSADERAQLTSLLTRIADEQKLTPGIHPGYRRLGGSQVKEK
jgi:DNA-binding MarR family transcriptional regulator